MANRKQNQKATPGPWVAWNDHAEVHAGPARENTPLGIRGTRGHIASVAADDWGGDDEDRGDAIARANARLIAQAPAMADYIANLVRDPPSCRSKRGEAAPVHGCDCWSCELIRNGQRLLDAAGA